MRTQAEWQAREQELVRANDLIAIQLERLAATMATYNAQQAVTDAEAAAVATEANRVKLRDAMNVEKAALQATIDERDAEIAVLKG